MEEGSSEEIVSNLLKIDNLLLKTMYEYFKTNPFFQDYSQDLGTKTLDSIEETKLSPFCSSSSSSFGLEDKLSSKMRASRQPAVANILQSKKA